ncbi:MAG: HEPN domain-containing protein, partial [Nitrospirae bacterium]|nr:HEPN domain-containing protein [Nitrospirota bacterium]
LIYLSNAVELEIPENLLQTIESLNDLSVAARYPEDIDALVKAFKKDRVSDYLKKTKEFLKWLKIDPRLKK